MYFLQDFYIPKIQKLTFHLPHVRIIGKHHFGNMRQKELKRRSYLQDILCRCDSVERVVSRFAHQIQYE